MPHATAYDTVGYALCMSACEQHAFLADVILIFVTNYKIIFIRAKPCKITCAAHAATFSDECEKSI